MIERHSATVLPFRDAALRAPIDLTRYRDAHPRQTGDHGVACDNVVSLAQFSGRGRRARRFIFAPPPDGEAA